METSFSQYTRISGRKDRLQSTMTMKFSRTVSGQQRAGDGTTEREQQRKKVQNREK